MFAINHAASALLFKKYLNGRVSFIWVLLAVQFVELIWVALNLTGIERITTEERIDYVGDIHLSYMPYSHSILTSVIIACISLLVFWGWSRSRKVGIIMGLAFLSHIVLDVITHARDLPLGFSNTHLIGLGLYSLWPALGFLLELGFGLFCWWYYKGSRQLLWIIIVFNIFNVSMFFPAVTGPEYYMANKPMLITIVILVQIILTLCLVGWAVSKEPAKVERS
jgi:hypothetical protein